MADISYVRTTWADGSEGGTPIDATKLNNIEQGIVDAVAAIGPNDTTADGTLKAQIDNINTAISPNAGNTSVNSNISYRIKNGICFVRVFGQTSNVIGISGLLIGTLPSGARPLERYVGTFNYNSSGGTGQIIFDTNGDITAYCGVNVNQLYCAYSFPL